MIVSMTPTELSGISAVETRIDASLFAALQHDVPVEACPVVAAELVEHDFDKKGVIEAYRTQLELGGQVPGDERVKNAEGAGHD